ncbi:MAG: ADP-ribosylglycohydrolase family protein, partial [Bacillota bacterium]|nr:ADP-ribosylglycohydrolase family protein [Bacillota bacterium]
LGKGWTAEEALSMALYCALKEPEDFEKALLLAVNHDGNSGGVGAICGNIMGAYLGSLEIPFRWLEKLELAELLSIGGDRLLEVVK